nr:formate dehydrogenase accessory sulfurtransferase FdhD [Pseudopedobacter sp.]
MSKASVRAAQIIKVSEGSRSVQSDLLAVEEPLEIRLGFGLNQQREQKSISVTMRTPGHDFELALGFLFTEGIIKDKAEIVQIKYCTDTNSLENKFNIVRVELNENANIDFVKLQRNFYTTSSCGVCGKSSIEAIRTACDIQTNNSFCITHTTLLSLPQALRKQQNVFEYTGGLHGCALFNNSGELLLSREDVGRHNALDKLIGAALGSGMIPLVNTVLLLSGRASFELIQKAAMAGIPVVAAVGAPSSLAVQLAKDMNITLVGFLRDERFNIYCGAKRIKM